MYVSNRMVKQMIKMLQFSADSQAHWQSSAESIVLGTLHHSSVLLDESRSGANAWITQRIKGGALPYLNVLEVNFIQGTR